jgi:hypothetical protein
MTLRFTADDLEWCYEFLAHLPPFRGWNLPDGHEVTFKVIRSNIVAGDYHFDRGAGRDVIRISNRVIGSTHKLIEIMAHEMIHLHQRRARMETKGEHNAAFMKLADEVCRHHHFDPKAF